jgi:CRP-like cAMP-binding protein
VADVDTLAGNRLLAMIPDGERALLAPELQPVLHDIRDQIYREGEPIEFVYFPLSGVLSLVTQMSDGRAIEVATIGNEGMAGLPVFLQATLTSAHQAFAQVPGESLRMPAARRNPASSRPRCAWRSAVPSHNRCSRARARCR